MNPLTTVSLLLLAAPLAIGAPGVHSNSNSSSGHCDKFSVFKFLAGEETWPRFLEEYSPRIHPHGEGGSGHYLKFSIPYQDMLSSTRRKVEKTTNLQTCLEQLDEDQVFEMYFRMDGPRWHGKQEVLSCPYKELLKMYVYLAH